MLLLELHKPEINSISGGTNATTLQCERCHCAPPNIDLADLDLTTCISSCCNESVPSIPLASWWCVSQEYICSGFCAKVHGKTVSNLVNTIYQRHVAITA